MKKICFFVIALSGLLWVTANNCGLSFTVNYPHSPICPGSYDSLDTVSVTILSGSPPFKYYWSNYDTNSVTLMGAGPFWVLVLDSNLCGDSVEYKTAYDTIPAKIIDQYVKSINILVNEKICVNPAQASLTLQVNLFHSPDSSRIIYHVAGIGADTSGYFTGLTTGTYPWYVTDTAGCILLRQDSTIKIPATLATDSFKIQTTNPVACVGDTGGKIIVTPYDVLHGPWQYSIDSVSLSSDSIFTGLSSGAYVLVLRNHYGCVYYDTVRVLATQVNDSFNIQTQAVTCMGAADGKITVTPYNVSDGPWRYSIDSVNLSSDSIFTNLSSGDYVLVMRNRSGCVYYDTAIVDSEACVTPCSAHFTLYPDTIVPHHWFALNQPTGSGALTYSWTWGDNSTADTGATPSHIYTDSAHYNICLTITDSTNCTSTYCDSSTYIRSSQSTMIYVNVVTQLPADTAVANGIAQIGNGKAAVSIYPNPVSTQLLIKASNFQPHWISIYDINGQQITGERFTPQVDISSLASGLYFIEIRGEENVVARTRFVKL